MEGRASVCSRPHLRSARVGLLFAALLLTGLATGQAGSAASKVCVPGPHSGHITADEQWCVGDEHRVEGTVTVDPEVTLTIEPGVVVQTPSYPYDIGIIVQGELQAEGTPTQPITLKSADSGGWRGLVVDGGSANLAYTTVAHGCSAAIGANIYVTNEGQLQMAGSLLQECPAANDRSLWIDGGTVNVSTTTFTTSTYPIYIAGAGSLVTLTGNILTGNDFDRILLASGAMMGHDTTLTPQAVWDGYQLERTLTVPPTVTLTLEPGVVVKTAGYPYDMGITVHGELQAMGTPSQPITLTSTTGGPTWAGLIVDGGSAHLDYTTVEYGCSDARKSNVAVINDGQLEMANSLVQECHFGGGAGERMLYIDGGRATVRNTTFASSDQYPVYIAGASTVVTLTENIVDANYYDRILLGASAMMGHDTTLTPQAVWDGYQLEGSLTVPPTVTLTLEPGVVIRTPGYPYDMGVIVQGELQAMGTPSQPITLTSTDGTPSWAGLIVDGGSAHLGYTTVEYGCSDVRKSNITVINDAQLEMANSLVQECQFGGGAGEESLRVEDSRASIRSTTFRESGGEHIYVRGNSTVLIAGSSIEGASEHGLLVEGDQAWVSVTGSSILSNGTWSGDGVRNTGQATVILSGDPSQGNFIAFNQDYGANQTGLSGQIIATYNFWGDPSGPTHAGNPGGIGEPVTDRVLYEPWLTEIPSGTLPASLVQAFGPNYVSSGETLNLGYLLHNLFTETLHSAVFVGQLPEEAEYILSTPEGEYWPGRHQVVWKLGDVAPGEAAYLAVQVRYAWGLEAHQVTYSGGLIAAENLPNDLIDLDEYLAYEQVTVASFDELSDQELADLLAADPDLNALFQDAMSQGFAYYGAAQLQHLSDGTDQVSLPMINTTAAGEEIYLYDDLGGSHRQHDYPTSVLGDSPSASYEYDYPTGRLNLWAHLGGALGQTSNLAGRRSSLLGCDDFGYIDCLRNCLINNLYSHQFDPGFSDSCSNCYKYGGAACVACASHLAVFHDDTVNNVVGWCESSCDADPDSGRCDSDARECASSRSRLITPCEDCDLDTSQNYFEPCPSGTRCVQGSCKPILYPETIPIEVLVAGDPNHMVGPEAMAPGQTVSYTIAFENVGEGTAYGVFVESRLPDLYDAGTLLLDDGGLYFPASRLLTWQVGELAPGAGGTVGFGVQVPTDALSGTVVVASATVYFPSVPETTPTGDVVSIVEDVVAYSQQVETTEGVPVPVTLTGYTPTGNPLAFQVAADPLHGELTGSAPNLIYTPAAGFEGVDYFTFRVSDGLNTSLPAMVMLTVQTGTESEPPEVLYTSPEAGAVHVPILDTPLGDGTYMPTIIAWFSEPLDPVTVTPDTVRLTGPAGQEVEGDVVFVAGPNRVEFRPDQPLELGTVYTVTITTGVHDTSGNVMAADHLWSFRTEGSRAVYLPLIRKNP
jgi:uncharacterized repeat protein (TIGR01451 family)